MENGGQEGQGSSSTPNLPLLQQQLETQLKRLTEACDGIIVQKIEEFKTKQTETAKTENQKKGKTLNDYLEFVRFFTTNASTVNRSLALGGIAIVWIFKKPDTVHNLQKGLLNCPLLFLAASLGLDLLQYFFGAVAWKIFYERKYWIWKNEKAYVNEYVQDIPASNWISVPIYLLWLLKILSMIIAYYYLLLYLSSEL